MPALEVDCTFVTVQILAAGFGDEVHVLTKFDADGPAGSFVAGLPYLRVLRIGGPDDELIADYPTMALHAFAATEADAIAICHRAMAYLRAVMGTVVAGAVLNRVRKLGGPTWALADNPAVEHQVLTLQLVVRAAY